MASAFGLGFGPSNCAFGQFGQTGQNGGITGGLTGGQTAGLTGQSGQNGLGLSSGLTGGLTGTQSSFGANPFGSGGLSGQASNPFSSTGMMGAATGGAGAVGAVGGTNLSGLTGAALNNRSMQNMGGMGGMGGRGGMGRGGQFNQNQNQNSNKPQIRATVKLGFEVAAPTNAATTQLINDRLRRIPSASLTGITVEMSGRTAVIRGKVNSPADGKVVERLLSLEPGIDAVKNELTYANGQAPAQPKPPTTRPAASTSRQEAEQASANVIEGATNAGTSAVRAAPEIVPAPGSR